MSSSPKFAQKETAKAASFFKKMPQQPVVKPEDNPSFYTLKSAPLKVVVLEKNITIYRKNKKIYQFTNNKLSDLYVSIHPQNRFVAFYGPIMNTDIDQVYLFDVKRKRIIYKISKAFLSLEWHKNKFLVSGRRALDFTKAYEPATITELCLATLKEKDVYQSSAGIILYLQKFKQQLYINELKTQFHSYYLLTDDYKKQPILDLHHQCKQELFYTKSHVWRIKHTFRKPFGELQRINFSQKKITKTVNFTGWVTIDSSSDSASETLILSQMNNRGLIRIVAINQNGTIKDTYELPVSSSVESMNYHQGRFYVYYDHLGDKGLVLVSSLTGKMTQRIEKKINQLQELTVQLKKHKNSWIYLYQLDNHPLKDLPTLIYTYGGFGIGPGFNVNDYYAFLKKGGVIAEVCPRGGLHEVFRYRWNTSRGHKEKTINDVISATKYLIEKGIAQKGQIGLTGASNGGFVVGAVMNKAPHLYRAVLSEVGVMDLVNYKNYTGGDVWSCEYGTKKSKLKKLSPIENIKAKQYPAIYVVSGQYDTRVATIHQIKYAKALKEHGHKVLFQSFPEGHRIFSRTLVQNTVKFFTHYLLQD